MKKLFSALIILFVAISFDFSYAGFKDEEISSKTEKKIKELINKEYVNVALRNLKKNVGADYSLKTRNLTITHNKKVKDNALIVYHVQAEIMQTKTLLHDFTSKQGDFYKKGHSDPEQRIWIRCEVQENPYGDLDIYDMTLFKSNPSDK